MHSWKYEDLRNLTTAWYQREITVPKEWTGRRTVMTVEYLNSLATVFVDKEKVGDVRLPAGEVDLTPFVQPGGKYVVSVFDAAVPLKAIMLSFNNTAAARTMKGSVPRRGLCGDSSWSAAPSRQHYECQS